MTKLTKAERLLWDTLKFSYDRSDKLRNNKQILKHIAISKKLGRITEPLGECIIWIATRYAGKAQWQGFTYRGDMISHAIMIMLRSVLKFNSAKSQNPFAYLTTVTSSAFINYLNKERREKEIKAQLLEEQKGIAEDNARN